MLGTQREINLETEDKRWCKNRDNQNSSVPGTFCNMWRLRL